MRGGRKSIWHDAKEEPQENNIIVIQYYTEEQISGRIFGTEITTIKYDRAFVDAISLQYTWEEYAEANRVQKWCYETDLENL